MALSSNFTQFITKKLSGLTSNKIDKSGSLSFGSLTTMNKYMSIFEESAADISSLDYEKIAEALKSGTLDGLDDDASKSIASIMNELLSVDEVNKMADTSEDGAIDASELEAIIGKIAGIDGNNENLTFEDIDKMFEELGVDLDAAAESAIKDALDEIDKEKEEDKVEDKEETTEAEKAKETQASTPASSSGGASSAGGSSGGSGAGPVSSSGKKDTGTAETPEEIQAKIDDKNDEIADAEAEAEDKIAEQEKQKEEAMKRAGVSDEEYEEYKKQEEELETKISEKEEAIGKKDDEISDYNSTISSNENYIASIETQIADNEARKASIDSDDEKASSKISEIESKISKLNSEKDKVESENKKLEEKVKQAEADKQKLEEEKTQLEADKAELLNKTLNQSEGFAKGIASGSAVNDIKTQIGKYDENISQIRADKDAKVSSLKSDIQDLQVQLKDAKAAEERSEFIKENKATCGLGLTGEELVDVAKQMLAKYGESHGYCATGVSRTFAMAYGLSLGGNGCDWDSNMDNLVAQGAFEEVTGDYATSADLANLPAGAVVCWENTGGTSGGGAQYGHVTIADGNGGEISDHYSSHIYTSIGGRSDLYRVYIPVT